MKKLGFIIGLLLAAVASHAQLAWVEPDPTIATEKITIYVDLSKLDLSLDHNQRLFDNAGPMYIWTWKPKELDAANPNVNGTGDKPWQNSNDALQMTPDPDKGAKVWKFEMTPTEFYGVSANEVYTNGLSFLVKPKNGGGYGDPDIKSNDINLPINPPKTDKGSVYMFPSAPLETQIVTLVYDNKADRKPGMQNLDAGTEIYAYLKATATDTAGVTTVYQPTPFFQVPNNPNLKMTYVGNGQWKLYMIPRSFFGIAANQTITTVDIVVRKKNWVSDDDSASNKPVVEFGCD